MITIKQQFRCRFGRAKVWNNQKFYGQSSFGFDREFAISAYAGRQLARLERCSYPKLGSMLHHSTTGLPFSPLRTKRAHIKLLNETLAEIDELYQLWANAPMDSDF